MTVNDENKKLVAQCGGVQILTDVLLGKHHNNDAAQRYALSALWNLAFDDEARELMLRTPGLVDAIKGLATRSESSKTREKAKGTLWTLGVALPTSKAHLGGERAAQEMQEEAGRLEKQWQQSSLDILGSSDEGFTTDEEKSYLVFDRMAESDNESATDPPVATTKPNSTATPSAPGSPVPAAPTINAPSSLKPTSPESAPAGSLSSLELPTGFNASNAASTALPDVRAPLVSSSPSSSEAAKSSSSSNPASAPEFPVGGNAAASNHHQSHANEHVMLSYEWGSQASVLMIKEALQKAGYRTWIDVDHMSGSTLEAMSLAVEGAACVLMCVSKKYKESQVRCLLQTNKETEAYH